MTDNKKSTNLGHSALWSVINQGLGQMLVFAVFLITARFVSKEAFGIMATAMLAIELFRQILIESVATTFYAKKAPAAQDYNAGFFIILIGGAVSAAVVFSFAQPIATLLGHNDIANTLRWISALLLTTGLSKMHEIWLTKHFQFKMLAIRSITSICIGGSVGVFMAVNGYGIESLITQQIVTAVISMLWLWSATGWRPSADLKWGNVTAIVKYGKFVSMNQSASMLSGQGDVLLSSFYLGPAATGSYSAAKRLMTAISLVISSGLNSVVINALASFSDDEDRFRNYFLLCVGLTAALTAPLFAGLSALSGDVIYVLMGSNWKDVGPVLSILAVVGFIASIAQYSANVLLIRRKAHWLTITVFADAAINILVLFFFARHGLNALALAFAIKTLILAPVVTLLALRMLNLKVSAYLKKAGPPLGCALLMGGVLYYLRSLLDFGALANIGIFVPVGATIYLIASFIFNKVALLENLEFLKRTLRKTA